MEDGTTYVIYRRTGELDEYVAHADDFIHAMHHVEKMELQPGQSARVILRLHKTLATRFR